MRGALEPIRLLPVGLVLLTGCVAPPVDVPPGVIPPTEPTHGPYFTDITEEAGILQGGGSGSGIAIIDIDGDAWPDIVLGRAAGPRIYRNNTDGTFTEIGDTVGLGSTTPCCSASMSLAAADFDEDGDADLFLGTLSGNRLFENRGDLFVDIALAAGTAGDPSVSTVGYAFADYDGDGDLDAYEANGTPLGAEGEPDRLLRNEGDGSFSDQSATLPLVLRAGAAFVAGWSDFDQDGDPDVYVVNDFGWEAPNQFFRNDGPGEGGAWTFSPLPEDCGCVLQENGMGMAIGDYDRDGWQDIFMGNGPGLPNEAVASWVELLLRNVGGGQFADATIQARAYVPRAGDRSNSWGVQFLDVDNDMWPDLFVPFGWYGQQEMDALLVNRGGQFEVEPDPGAGTTEEGRSVVPVDIDMDGCLDVVLTAALDSARLYRNRCETGYGYLMLKLQGTESNRDAVGAVVRLTAAGLTQREEVFAGSTSSHSSQWKVLHFGMGNAPSADAIEVTWPSGLVETFTDVEADTYYRLVEGSGDLEVIR